MAAVLAAMVICALFFAGCPTSTDSSTPEEKSGTVWAKTVAVEETDKEGNKTTVDKTNTFKIYEDLTFKCTLEVVDLGTGSGPMSFELTITGKLKDEGDNKYQMQNMEGLAAGYNRYIVTLVYSAENTKLTITCISGDSSDTIKTINSVMGGDYIKQQQ